MSKLKPKTQKQIDGEIKKLKELKPFIRPFTVFGDDNKARMDIDIAVLENDYDEDDIDDKYDPDEDYDANSAARNTLDWRLGSQDEESPYDNWKGLDTRKKKK